MLRRIALPLHQRCLMAAKLRIQSRALVISGAEWKLKQKNQKPWSLSSSSTSLPSHPIASLSIRTFATSNKKKSSKKKRSSGAPEGARFGRVAVVEKGIKQGKAPKICSGCGVQVVGGDATNDGRMMGGEVVEEQVGRSKNRKKQARYADALELAGSAFLCQRCKQLSKDNVWGAYDALRDVDPAVFNAQLKHIVSRRRFSLCIKVVDATDPEFTTVRQLRKSIGSTPIILAVSKIDLVPRMSHHDLRHIQSRLRNRGINVVDTFGVSAKTGAGVVELARALLEQLGGRDVFVVGCANVGKSSLVKALTPTIAQVVKMRTKRRDQLGKLNVVGSHLPGTTLQAVRVPCFSSKGHALWDTPGVINSSALSYHLFPSHLMEPLTRPEPIQIPDLDNKTVIYARQGESILIEAPWMNSDASPEDNRYDESEDVHRRADPSATIENGKPRCCLARIDILETKNGGSVEVRPYLLPALSVRVVKTNRAPDEARIPDDYVKHMKKSVPNLEDKEYALPLKPFVKAVTQDKVWDEFAQRYTMDIVLAGLGWMAFFDRSVFVLEPRVVEGSLWSHRKCLYPRNLEGYLDRHGSPEQEVTELTQDVARDLGNAAREGRHLANRRRDNKMKQSGEEEWDDYEGWDDFV